MATRPAGSPSTYAGTPMMQQPASITNSPSTQSSTSTDPLSTSGNITSDLASTKPKPEKLKQSKSRNGCVTCKGKRLKCDETKPTCQQCHKRGVECGGYKKDFKWRTFEENNFTSKQGPAKSKKATSPKTKPAQSQSITRDNPLVLDSTRWKTTIPSTTSIPPYDLTPPTTARLPDPVYPYHNSFADQGAYLPDSALPPIAPIFPDQQLHYLTPSYSNDLAYDCSQLDSDRKDDGLAADPHVTSPTTFSGRSPRLIDILAPGTELNARPGKVINHETYSKFQPLSITTANVNHVGLFEDDDIEEIIRQPEPEPQAWIISSPSPASTSSSTSSDGSLYRQPDFSPGSIEMLMRRFDQNTCGMLAIVDGPTENPWRTLVWPMADEAPALHYAIASMAAFHTSMIRSRRSLRMIGIEHMRESIKHLAAGIAHMPTEIALATTLALAFSESWDQPTTTGATHLQGAKIFVNQALNRRRPPRSTQEFARLKYLISIWMYMDVLSRLTSLDTEDTVDYDQITHFFHGPSGADTELDPLMGCTYTLFPLIGQTANLVRRVRKSQRNSSDIIAQAIQLKSRIESWKSADAFQPPEDPCTTIEHCLHTAEAYRWATLLYLHQAVPEIPSLTTADLAEKSLVALAMVPTTSRTTIAHFFPLMVAGSEVVRPESRDWVEDRWHAMTSRMWIGNVERCWEVVKEVWRRRDVYDEEQRMKALFQRGGGGSRNVPVGCGGGGIAKRKLGVLLLDDDDDDDGRTAAAAAEMNLMVQREKRVAMMTYSGIPTPFQLNNRDIRSSSSTTEYLPSEILPYERTIRGSVNWAGVMKGLEWEG
ncbi:MAG: hypothetical protein M1816_008070 [Peltula sp. TS41687]|nr:MAG: hypothetical protein M1816_008070 [Peltula sp. TS41687]